MALSEFSTRHSAVAVIGIDFVPAGLRRAKERLENAGIPRDWSLSFVAGNLQGGSKSAMPLAPGCADAVLASLVINYVQDAPAFLAAIFQLLKPGGRMVVSGLRRDADTSRICVDGLADLRTGGGLAAFGVVGEQKMEGALVEFINNAGRLLDLEERGWFQFWDGEELKRMASDSGFVDVSVAASFGSPPQAVLLSCIRPRLE